jgi:hypothetical protein
MPEATFWPEPFRMSRWMVPVGAICRTPQFGLNTCQDLALKRMSEFSLVRDVFQGSLF